MRKKILHTASELFLTIGVKSVTMDDIAEKMAISKKTIYEYYKNKTALVRAATNLLFKQISQQIDRIGCEECKDSPIHTLFHINEFIVKNIKENIASQYQLSKYYPIIAEELNEKKFDLITEGIIDNLEKGIDKGLYRKNINKQIISKFYYASFNALQNSEIFPSDKYLFYHIRAIATPKGLKELETIIKNEL